MELTDDLRDQESNDQVGYNLATLLESEKNMISVQGAKEIILQYFTPTATVTIPIADASGRILAEDVKASFDFPIFDNSSVDGFAIRAEDVVTASGQFPTHLHVIADIPAGSQHKVAIGNNQAARIMTGAPLPKGADAVVMVEDTDANFSEAGIPPTKNVSVFHAVKKSENIRHQGSDFIKDQNILSKGTRLTPQALGLMAMLGFSSVQVRKKPLVALFSSGDELLSLKSPLTSGKIYDSNSTMLASLFQNAGCEVIRLGVAKDSFASVHRMLFRAIELKPDLIVSSAGVSIGAFDFVKQVIESDGELNLWKINMRPGKPLAFGTIHSVPFFGLPGNPVASFVGFMVFLKPVIDKLTGDTHGTTKIKVKVTHDIESDGRESYLRAVVHYKDHYFATLTGHQGSGNLLSLVQANALLVIPAGVTTCKKDAILDAILLGTF